MKTLFVQTHEIARALRPDYYTCHQLEWYLIDKHCMHWRYAVRNSSIIMEMLFKEQKEFRKFDNSKFMVLENILDGNKYGVDGRLGFSDVCLTQIRQRLINSLLTRPDRTLCVLDC